MKTGVNNKYRNSVAELTSDFPVTKLGDTGRMINNIYPLLRAVLYTPLR
jgi:hypothetical protein